MARAKKRGFVNRMLKTYCTDFANKHNNGTKRTNRIIRKRLKQLLTKDINEYYENN